MSSQISTATNLQGPDLSVGQNDPAKFFNNFFALNFTVGPDNDAIVAYFEQYTGTVAAGKALAAAVLYTAQSQNINPMQVLADFQKLTPGQLNSYLAAFLNFNRVPTSIIGIKSQSSTNPYVERSIIP
jgi:hypothetical protein